MPEVEQCLTIAKQKCMENLANHKEVRQGLRNVDLQTLEPNEWLNDVIVNKYLELLVANKPNSGVLSSFFYEEICRNTQTTNLLPVKWWNLEKLLIPLCIDSHWSLLYSIPDQKRIFIYNSMKPTTQELECVSVIFTSLIFLYNNRGVM